MSLQLFLLLVGALLLANQGLGEEEKGAFERILEVNLAKGWFVVIFSHLRELF